MHSRLLFLDIETVPDTEILAADFSANAFPPKPIQHRVVAISFLSASLVRDGRFERYVVEECRSGGELDPTEEHLLRGFWREFDRNRPRVVTWNGRGLTCRSFCNAPSSKASQQHSGTRPATAAWAMCGRFVITAASGLTPRAYQRASLPQLE